MEEHRLSIPLESDSLEYALFLCRGYSSGSKISVSNGADCEASQILVLDEAVTPNFEDRIQTTPSGKIRGTAHIRVVMMTSPEGAFIGEGGVFMEDISKTYSLLEEHWAINMRDVGFLSSQLISSYHSRAVSINGTMCLEICYNITQSLSYNANDTDPLESSMTVNTSGRASDIDMMLHHKYESLYFRYNATTGQTTYILLDTKRERRDLLNALGERLETSHSKLHPFALLTVIIFTALSTRTREIDNLFRRLLWIETQLQQGSIFEITDSEEFAKYIRRLHAMSRALITLEHNNQRDRSNVDHLLRDHARLWKLTKKYPGAQPVDHRCHERTRDNLLCLRDFCIDRQRQILNLRSRTQDLITLLYNLITGRDSATNLRIATQSAHIAHKSKQDSTSMKTIAGVTMFYLPATFVCSLFGTNLVALNTNDSEPTFVVSKWWWLYLVCTVPLTAFTILGFMAWQRWREGRRRHASEKIDV